MKGSFKLLVLILFSMPLYNFSCDNCFSDYPDSVQFIFMSESNSGCYLPPEEIKTNSGAYGLLFNAHHEIEVVNDSTFITNTCQYFNDSYGRLIPVGGNTNLTILPEEQTLVATMNLAEQESTFLFENKTGELDTISFSYKVFESNDRNCDYDIGYEDLAITKNTFSTAILSDAYGYETGHWVVIYID